VPEAGARLALAQVRSHIREMNELLARITIRPEQCHGHPCVRGMRIRVSDVLEMLAAGTGEEEILADFPDLEADDIRACLAYAASLAGHPVVIAAG
jgi:uncharacterized protein (DUF433 family)